MLVKWMVVVLNLLVFSFVIYVESTGTGHSPTAEDNTPDEYNHPLVMINVPRSLPHLPTTLEITNGEPILKNGSNSDTSYFCPTEDTTILDQIKENENTRLVNERNCLSQTTFDESSPKRCKKKVHPYLKKYSVNHSFVPLLPFSKNDDVRCGMDHNGKFYGFSYLICLPGNKEIRISKFEKILKKDVVIYEFCYVGDKDNQRILYTRHVILSPSVLKNVGSIKDLASFKWNEISTDPYEEFGDVFVNMKEQIRKAELVPHMSVSPYDMAFGTWKKPLYHYSNIMGMPKNISKVWNFVDDRIRYAAMQSDSEFEVYMGEFTSEEGKFWVKLVLDAENSMGVAIIIMENLPRELKKLPKNSFRTAMGDPQLNGLTKLNKVLENCTETLYMQNWEGIGQVKNNLDLVRFCTIYDEHFILFGLLLTEVQTQRNKKRKQKLYASDYYPSIASNFLNFNYPIYDTKKKVSLNSKGKVTFDI